MTFMVLVSDTTRFAVEADTVAEAEVSLRARFGQEGKTIEQIRHKGTVLLVTLAPGGG